MNYIKKFKGFIDESSQNIEQLGKPAVGDTVFAIGFAFDYETLINNYSGYGKIFSISPTGEYYCTFGDDSNPDCYDSSGINDNAPEGISFSDNDIVYFKDGIVGVYLFNFIQ